jgi:hypothetical protein
MQQIGFDLLGCGAECYRLARGSVGRQRQNINCGEVNVIHLKRACLVERESVWGKLFDSTLTSGMSIDPLFRVYLI